VAGSCDSEPWGFYKIWKISLVAEDLVASQGLCCIVFVSDCHLVCIHSLVSVSVNGMGAVMT
jgi:hypothetical protein